MKLEILQTIALLCANQETPSEALKCQKYYIKCIEKKIDAKIKKEGLVLIDTKPIFIEQCILER